MNSQIKTNLTQTSTWLRGAFMLLFVLIYSVAEMVLAAVVLFQFISALLAGRPNSRLLDFGHSLSIFLYQIFLYLTYNTEDKPYPFASWPSRSEDRRRVEQDRPL